MAAMQGLQQAAPKLSRRADAVDLAKRHLVQPWPFAGSIGTEARSLIGSGDGIYITDGDGKRLIDGPAGMWCVNVGHRREELARVMYDQAMQLSYNTPWYTMNAPSAELARAHRRPCAGRSQPRLLHHRRLVGGRDGAALHAVLQQCARPAGKEADPQPRRRLSWLDLSVGLAQRPAARPRLDGRRRRAGRQAVVARSVPPAGRHDASRPSADFLVDEFRDTVAAHRRRQDRRLRRRAGAGIGRRHRAAGRLSQAHPRDLPRQRHPLCLRRGGHRLRPAWPCLCLGGRVRHRART